MPQRFLQEPESFDMANSQSISLSGSSQQSAAIAASAVWLASTQPVWVAIGANPTASAGAGSMLIPAATPLRARITRNDKVAAIQGGTGGILSIVPVI